MYYELVYCSSRFMFTYMHVQMVPREYLYTHSHAVLFIHGQVACA